MVKDTWNTTAVTGARIHLVKVMGILPGKIYLYSRIQFCNFWG